MAVIIVSTCTLLLLATFSTIDIFDIWLVKIAFPCVLIIEARSPRMRLKMRELPLPARNEIETSYLLKAEEISKYNMCVCADNSYGELHRILFSSTVNPFYHATFAMLFYFNYLVWQNFALSATPVCLNNFAVSRAKQHN